MVLYFGTTTNYTKQKPWHRCRKRNESQAIGCLSHPRYGTTLTSVNYLLFFLLFFPFFILLLFKAITFIVDLNESLPACNFPKSTNGNFYIIDICNFASQYHKSALLISYTFLSTLRRFNWLDE